jgi:hypothetical protein
MRCFESVELELVPSCGKSEVTPLANGTVKKLAYPALTLEAPFRDQ